MFVVNFAHPLTERQLEQVEVLAGRSVSKTIEQMAQFDDQRPLSLQVREMVNEIPLDSNEWQTVPLLVNLPGFAPATACLLAELHGRIGFFPPALRLRPVSDSVVREYEVAEILDLQTTRDDSRRLR